MTANRGPEPNDPQPVPFSTEWWRQHPEASDALAPAQPGFSEEEIERLMLVKPTPYMDEPDRLDPSWTLPEAPPDEPKGKDGFYMGGNIAFWRWMMGLDKP